MSVFTMLGVALGIAALVPLPPTPPPVAPIDQHN